MNYAARRRADSRRHHRAARRRGVIRGEGCWLFDDDGKKYLDLGSAQGVAMLGHCHPGVTAAIQEQAETLTLCPNYLYNDMRAEFAAGAGRACCRSTCRTCFSPTAAPKPSTAR